MSSTVQSIEEGRVRVDFENVWHQLANMEWSSLKDACEFAYRQGRGAGRTDGIRLALSNENESSPYTSLSQAVRAKGENHE